MAPNSCLSHLALFSTLLGSLNRQEVGPVFQPGLHNYKDCAASVPCVAERALSRTQWRSAPHSALPSAGLVDPLCSGWLWSRWGLIDAPAVVICEKGSWVTCQSCSPSNVWLSAHAPAHLSRCASQPHICRSTTNLTRALVLLTNGRYQCGSVRQDVGSQDQSRRVQRLSTIMPVLAGALGRPKVTFPVHATHLRGRDSVPLINPQSFTAMYVCTYYVGTSRECQLMT